MDYRLTKACAGLTGAEVGSPTLSAGGSQCILHRKPYTASYVKIVNGDRARQLDNRMTHWFYRHHTILNLGLLRNGNNLLHQLYYRSFYWYVSVLCLWVTQLKVVKRLEMAAHIVIPTLEKLWLENGKPGLSAMTFSQKGRFFIVCCCCPGVEIITQGYSHFALGISSFLMRKGTIKK